MTVITDRTSTEIQSNRQWITLLLSAIAGYCDTSTFIAGNGTFSAHITGNFVVLAAQLANHADPNVWVKLITFPMFVISVTLGGWLAAKTGKRYVLFLAEGILLLFAGGTAFWLSAYRTGRYEVVMITVLALGFQNAFSKLFPKETYGPTTIMTGNVTQALLDLRNLFMKGFQVDNSSLESIKKQLFLLGGFLAGCFLGGLVTSYTGLQAVMLPGLIMVICYFICKEP